MQLPGHVHQVQRERVLTAANAAKRTAVARPRRHDLQASRSSPASAGQRRSRVQDHVTQHIWRSGSSRREVGADQPAARVDLMAGRTAPFAGENGFTRCGVARGAGGRHRGPVRHALDVGDQLPDFVGRQRRKRRHLRAGDAGTNGARNLIVVAASREDAGRERRRTVVDAVTRLATARVAFGAGGDRRGVARERIPLARPRLLTGQHKDRTHAKRDRKDVELHDSVRAAILRGRRGARQCRSAWRVSGHVNAFRWP